MCSSSPYYAVIDLGSDSFHMLVVREMYGSIQTLTRIKRKVRLAAGLDIHRLLSDEAMQRGWQCLRLFAERLRNIPPVQISVVATLRIARNAEQFVQQANSILGCPIRIISGEEEARLIYQGAAQTTGGPAQRLVVDIGGASTELIAGQGNRNNAKVLFNLPMGCVTGLKRDFHDHRLTEANFAHAESAARALIYLIAPTRVANLYRCLWHYPGFTRNHGSPRDGRTNRLPWKNYTNYAKR